MTALFKSGKSIVDGKRPLRPRRPGGQMTTSEVNRTSPPLMAKHDVMALLKISRSTIQAAMLAGELGFVKFGRAVRFRPADVDLFVAAHRTGPTKMPASRRRK